MLLVLLFFCFVIDTSEKKETVGTAEPAREKRNRSAMSRYKSSNSSIKSHLSTVSLPKEEVNIVLLGKQNVGKSALVVKYLTKRFIREYDPFLGQ